LDVAGEGRSFMIAKKSQSPSAKALRHMSYYFDYDKYNEEMNSKPYKPAKPDKRRKKIRKNKKRTWDMPWD